MDVKRWKSLKVKPDATHPGDYMEGIVVNGSARIVFDTVNDAIKGITILGVDAKPVLRVSIGAYSVEVLIPANCTQASDLCEPFASNGQQARPIYTPALIEGGDNA